MLKACSLPACTRRFQTTFLGSRAVTGDLVGLGMLDAEDRAGESLADVLYKHGYQGSEEALQRNAYEPGQIRGCVGSGPPALPLCLLLCLSCPSTAYAGPGAGTLGSHAGLLCLWGASVVHERQALGGGRVRQTTAPSP